MIKTFIVAAALAATSFVSATATPVATIAPASIATGGRELVDKVVARVNGRTITLSQATRPQIANNGKSFPLEQYLVYLLWHQRAQERQIEAPADDVARNIAQYKQDNGLVGVPDDEADRLLKGKLGIDFATYKSQLEEYFMIESLKSHEFRSRCSVAEAEVRAYYDKHPIVVPAAYKIDLVSLSPEEHTQWNAGTLAADRLEWITLDWLDEQNLAQHLKELTSWAVLHSGVLADGQGGHLLVHLVDKKETYTQTLAERYHAIEVGLQRDKVARHAHEAEAEILRDAVVVIFE